MKFIYKSLFFIFIIFVTHAIAIGEQQNQQSLSQDFLKLMEQDSFDKAASLFHYPKTYTIEKKKEEFKSVKQALKRYKRHLGNIVEQVNHMPNGKFIGIGISGADLHYWKKNQEQSAQTAIPCKFEKVEFGVIRILFCNIDNQIEIQSVDYAFIETDESKRLLKKLIKK